MEYKISTIQLANLKHQLASLDKRAGRLGLEWAFDLEIDPLPEMVTRDGFGIEIWTVQVTGRPLMLKGWQLVAKLDHLPGSGTLIKRVPGIELEIPALYRTATPICEHCGTNRYRVATYLVLYKDGKTIKQVGSSCLKDFTGYPSPEQLTSLAELMTNLIQTLDDSASCDPFSDFGFGFDKYHINLEVYLRYVAREVDLSGWVSRSRAPMPGAATADQAYNTMTDKLRLPSEYPTESHCKIAKGWLTWVREGLTQKAEGDLSNFEHNLIAICEGEYIKYDDIGLAAAVAYAYQVAHKPEVEESESEYVGEVKVRLELSYLLLVDIFTPDNSQSRFGPVHKHTFRDQAGNTLVWWTGKQLGAPGSYWSGKGTVKKHDTWRGVKETTFTRCALVEVSAPPAKLL